MNELRRDPRNHCVPIFDVFVDTRDPTISFIVMPFLLPIDRPEFDTVGSILKCIEQLLEVSPRSIRLIGTELHLVLGSRVLT